MGNLVNAAKAYLSEKDKTEKRQVEALSTTPRPCRPDAPFFPECSPSPFSGAGTLSRLVLPLFGECIGKILVPEKGRLDLRRGPFRDGKLGARPQGLGETAMDGTLTLSAAARELKIHASTLRRWIRNGAPCDSPGEVGTRQRRGDRWPRHGRIPKRG